MKIKYSLIFLLSLLVFAVPVIAKVQAPAAGTVKIKDLVRLNGAKDNALIGYGIVTGLAGTGDSARSAATLQSIKNVLTRFGVNVAIGNVRSRNSAGVMVTANLPAYAQPGDKLDVNVTSLGDARSLLGGTLLLTHLMGADNNIYGLSQGALSVGGYKYDLNGNVIQKNHPTAANIPAGATVERNVKTKLVDDDGYIELVLHDPDFTTAEKITKKLRKSLNVTEIRAIDAARIKVFVPENDRRNLVSFITRIESVAIEPETRARVVINERTGTVVAGGGVRISPVTITHGDITLSITTEFSVSQPNFIFGSNPGVQTRVVPDTMVEVEEDKPVTVTLSENTNIAELVSALNAVKASSRDIITILQGIKRAGALHAELVIQ